MNKKALITIITSIIILAIFAGGFWKWKEIKKVEEVKRAEEQKQKEDQKQNNDQDQDEIDTSDWKTYRNEEYGFEVKYPKELEFNIKSSNPNKLGKEDSFIFQKEKHLYFAIFTNGGFGYGIKEPKKITQNKFKGKNAEMYWYNDSFPNFIHIVDKIPNNWNNENVIEIRTEDSDNTILNIFQKMYESFQFVE